MTLKRTVVIASLVAISFGCGPKGGEKGSEPALDQANTSVPSASADSRKAAAVSTHKLEMIVTGAAALVAEPGRWTAVMPNWPQDKKGKHGHIIPAHRPFLLVPVQDPSFFPADSRQPDKVITPPKGIFKDKQVALFYLENEWLRLTDASPVPPLTNRDPGIVSMDAVCASAKSGLKHDKEPQAVAARVEIGPSSLRVGKRTKDQWFFEPTREERPDPPATHLAQEVILAFDFGDHFSFEPTSQSGWKDSKPIRFAGVLTDVRIALGSAPNIDILGEGEEYQHEKVDPHFEALYNLMDHPGKPHIPKLKPDSRLADKKAGGSNCPPVTWP